MYGEYRAVGKVVFTLPPIIPSIPVDGGSNIHLYDVANRPLIKDFQ